MNSSGNLDRPEPLIMKGSVLALPVEKDCWALGLVISPGVNFYLGLALDHFDNAATPSDIEGRQLKLFSWTNDAEVFRGNWKNVGVSSLVPNIELPEYRVYIDGRPMVESFDGSNVREFDPITDKSLAFRKIRSPLLVQDAVQAAFGFGAWKVGYQDMVR